MKFYEISVRAMEKVLRDCGEDSYADYISECLVKWTASSDTEHFLKAFSKGGKFDKFNFDKVKFESEEKKYWTSQYFGGLVAMAMQLAKFERDGRNVSIDFIKSNFGHQAEVISGSMCGNCKTKYINMADIDRYVTIPVVSGAIIEGLEKGDLIDITEQVMNLSYKRLSKERDEARLRAANTNIDVSSGRTPISICLKCGGKNIGKCRFLKSLKKNSFVALTR